MDNLIKRFLLLWILFMAILNVSAYDFEEGGIYYNILPYGHLVEVTKKGVNGLPYEGDFVVPAYVLHDGQEYIVVGIGERAFSSTKITSIKFPETISSIGEYAFRDCTELKEISIPKGVSTLSIGCFSGCTGLEEIKIPSSVVKIHAKPASSRWDGGNSSYTYNIEYGCFYNCTNLKKVIFEDGNTPITFYDPRQDDKQQIYAFHTIFYGCPIEELYLGREFAKWSYGFENLATLKDVKIGPNVKSLEHMDFLNTAIKKFVVPDNVTNISCAFPKETIEELYMGNGVTSFTLNWGENLKHVYIGNNLETLYLYTGDKGAKNLEDIVITSSKMRKVLEGSENRNGVRIYLPQKDMYPNDITKGEKLSIVELIGTTQEYTGETPKFNFSSKLENAEFSYENANIPKGAGSYKENLPVEIKIGDWKSNFNTEVAYTVTKAPLTVIADNVELPYGSEKKDFTVSYFGFKNGEDESVLKKPVTISTTAKTDSPVGTYPIIPFGGYADNYTLSYERGVLTVVKAEQTIAWTADMPDEATVGTKIKLEATASSGLPVSFKSSDNSIASVSVVDGEYYLNCKKAGDVEITACQPGNKNYESAADEVRSLTIVASTGIDDVENTADTAERIYDTNGNVIKKLQRGVNIIRRSDGTVRKVVVR